VKASGQAFGQALDQEAGHAVPADATSGQNFTEAAVPAPDSGSSLREG